MLHTYFEHRGKVFMASLEGKIPNENTRAFNNGALHPDFFVDYNGITRGKDIMFAVDINPRRAAKRTDNLLD
jgi:hypothetical protein